MASFDPIDDEGGVPPRPETPPVRRGFVMVLLVLLLAAVIVYGVPYMAERIGYRYEVGRARADIQALEKLDEEEIVGRASLLFRLASGAVQPAVVNIRTVQLGAGPPLPGGPQGRAPMPGIQQLGSGSGVVIDADKGYVVTNHHVIKDADQIVVRLGRRELKARLVGSDQKTDLAVLQVEAPLNAEARWGDSDALDIGDWVLAIGSPFELDRTVTAGIVSATGRSGLPIMADLYQDFIQTDAAINPGNSGGPLINLKGEVIGINTAIFSETGGSQGIGLAISSEMARKVVEQLISEGRVIRGYLGVTIEPVDGAQAERLGLDEPSGALVREVVPGSPAERAGLAPGDVVVAIGDEPVDGPSALQTRTVTLPVDRPVPVTVVRDGDRRTIEVTIKAMPVLLDLGLLVVEGPPEGVDPEWLDRMEGDPATSLFIADVVPGSPAARAGLVPMLRVTAVGPVPVDTIATLNDLAASRYDPEAGLDLQVETPDGTPYRINVGGPDSRPRR